jgi:hypothetical protein
MVKFYSSTYTYDYPFPAVTLAYFLRYPNPYSRHVASTDTIERHYDPETQRLTTVRLHLKRSRIPPAVLKLLPKSMKGDVDGGGRTQSFILEKSVVDVREGWMETESRNLDWNNVLSVIERHTYSRPPGSALPVSTEAVDSCEEAANAGTITRVPIVRDPAGVNRTDVDVTVILKSRIGEQIRRRRQRWGEQASATSVTGGEMEEQPVRQGWLSSWSSGAVRSAIEAISLQRTERSQPKAQKGMSVVLDRLRNGGLEAVLEGMRRDREVEI